MVTAHIWRPVLRFSCCLYKGHQHPQYCFISTACIHMNKFNFTSAINSMYAILSLSISLILAGQFDGPQSHQMSTNFACLLTMYIYNLIVYTSS